MSRVVFSAHVENLTVEGLRRITNLVDELIIDAAVTVDTIPHRIIFSGQIRPLADATIAATVAPSPALSAPAAGSVSSGSSTTGSNVSVARPAPPKAAKAKPKRLGAKWDYAEVAKVCREAAAVGIPLKRALIDRYGCTPTTASWLPQEARRNGHDVGKAKLGRPASTPKPAPQPKITPARDGLLAQAAILANEAIRVGMPPGAALAAELNMTLQKAGLLVARLRKHELLDPAPKPNIRVVDDTPAGATPRPPLPEIAATYTEAIAAGRKPIQTIIDRYDCTRDEARTWVGHVRDAGLLPPRTEPQVPVGEAPLQMHSHGASRAAVVA